MKLAIKKEFFDLIKKGKKSVEWRDAHITFVCEETREELVRDIVSVHLVPRVFLHKSLRLRDDLFSDDWLVEFVLRKR